MLGRFGRCLVAVPLALGAATLVAVVLLGVGSLLLALFWQFSTKIMENQALAPDYLFWEVIVFLGWFTKLPK
jgi:hypothetical protein